MGTVRDEKPDEESMSDADNEVSKEDEETDDDDDDDDDYSVETDDNGHSEDDNQDAEKGVEVNAAPRVLRRAPSRKLQDGKAADKVDQDNVVMSEAGKVALDPGHGDVMPGRMKRQRLHGKKEGQRPHTWDDLFKMHSEDWNEDSEDDDWCPMGAIKMPLLWFCTNCTMPNSEKLSMCGKCGENRKSGVLTEGHLASSTVPAEPPPASDAAINTIPNKDASPRVFPVDSKTECGKTLIGFDERMLLHDENPNAHPHPERPDRLRAILAGLAAEGLFPGRCIQRPAREATRLELEQVHSREHVDAVEGTCNEELSYFTSDTYANKDSSLAARLAAGISADLATAIVKGEAQNGFALVRPPGHHAEQVTVMGFCLHNNASVAAKAAQAAGAKKVLIVDWDVHHGNGTQDIFEEDPSVLYISLHRHEGGTFYPGTGAADEVGSGKGEGSSVNIPWICSGIGDNDYIFAFLHIVLPIAKQFAPDITIISAGFDAARGDPLGSCEVTPSGYAHMTSMLNSLSGGKMLVILEGGYNLRSISASASAVIKVLVGDRPGPAQEDLQPTEAGAISMLNVFAIQSRYWPTLHMPEFLQRVTKMASSNSQKKGTCQKRRCYHGGPVWWKWGRRRVIYHLWCVAGTRKNKWNSRHVASCEKHL
ncbi:unnamed protein product [Calypogeia fissa]